MNHRTRIKICGITRVEDALLACELGADAIGLVMTPSSPRCIDVERAVTIRNALPPFVSTVVVTMNAMRYAVEKMVGEIHPDLLQFHGSEERSFCESFTVPYIKALSMNEMGDTGTLVAESAAGYFNAAAIMLDGRSTDGSEGGKTFDWTRVPKQIDQPLILAGGLNAGNVIAAINQIHPHAVDVSSGVESAAGCKDKSKLADFFRAVKDAG